MNPLNWRSLAPIHHQTPLLMFHGTQDFLPIAFMENFYWKLASQGTPVRMIKFVGSGYSLDASEYQLYAVQEMIQGFPHVFECQGEGRGKREEGREKREEGRRKKREEGRR